MHMSIRRRLIGVLAAMLLVAALPATAQIAADTVAPEAATGRATSSAVHATKQMVVAANPLAAQAGLDVLRNGGSAADALVAVQTLLGLVEPQSSGLGGGGFLVWYDAKTGKVSTLDGRETAPDAVWPNLFLDEQGKPMEFFDAVVGGRSVGTPGAVALMSELHARHGKLPWSGLFARAIDLSRQGFEVSPRLATLIEADREGLATQPTTRAYFFDKEGKPLAAGTTLRNPAYAESLEEIAIDGPKAFYEGHIAAKMIEAVAGHATNPGLLSLQDLKDYEAKWRDPVCAPYRGFEVCGMGPPSSGALTIGQILGIASHFDIATLGPDDPETWRIIGDATRLAFADRGRYMADADFVTMPKGLLNADYLKARAELIHRPTALPEDAVKAGDPPWEKAELRIDGFTWEAPSTSHFVIVDADGNVASMTTSIENGFGARLMAAGFLLNNQLTDFSFVPEEGGEKVANRVEPGKRPRSSMSPTIVMKDGKPVHVLGSPGGSNIIPYVATAIVALIDWKMDMQQAVSLPHLSNRFGRYDLEAGTSAEEFADDLQALGYKTRATDLNSGLHGVTISAGALTGGADPRREGVAVGD